MEEVLERVNSSLIGKGKNKTLPKSLEIELRVKQMTRDRFNELYLAVSEIAELGKTVESVTLNYDNKRKEIIYNGEKKISESIITKNELYKHISKVGNNENYRIVLSEELPYTGKFENKLAKVLRLRLRQSFKHGEWKIEFTYSLTLSSAEIQTKFAEAKKAFDVASSAGLGDFLKREPKVGGNGVTYEVEAEWHGAELAESDINAVVELLVGSVSYETVLDNVARLLGVSKSSKTLKSLVDQPISFDKNTYYEHILPKIDEYYLSDKADGERCLIMLDSTSYVITTSAYKKLPVTWQHGICLVDCEMLNMTEFYAFDLLVKDGTSLMRKTYTERITELNGIELPDIIQKKILVKLTRENYIQEIPAMLHRDRTYTSDGLIFTNQSGKKTYKWKPSELSTIDFLTIPVPKSLLGVEPYMPKPKHEMYWLFCGMSKNSANRSSVVPLPELKKIIGEFGEFVPVHFTTPELPNAYIYYHPGTIAIPDDMYGVIGEYIFNTTTQSFELKKLRPDKYDGVKAGTQFGNSCKVAKETLDLVLHPFNEADLIAVQGSAEGDKYFQTQKSDLYKPMVKFNNFVVSRLIKSIENTEWVIDLAAGRGNHIFTYNGYGVKNGLFIDIDKDAIAELIKRVDKFDNSELYIYSHKKPNKHMKVYAKVIDLSQNYADVLASIEEFPLPKKRKEIRVNAIVMTFALHYIVDNLDNMNNFADLIDSILDVGGVLILTFMNGKLVYDLLSDVKTGETWPTEQNEKYSIKKLYPDSAKFTNFGMKISLIHPFSAGEYYEEYLVGIPGVVEVFQKRGYKVRQEGSFLDYIGNYEKFNNSMFMKMDDYDKIYSGLYSYLVLWKSK